MARGALLILLAVGVVGSTLGLEVPSAKEYLSNIMGKASSYIPKLPSKDEIASSFQCLINNGVHKKPGDCDSYIKCTNWLPHVLACPTGLHFKEETGKCVSPCDAHCDEDIACECGWESCDDTDDLPSKLPPENGRIAYDYLCSENGLFPNSRSCAEYIQCVNQISYYMDCPDGLHFSPQKRKCLPPCEARCDRAYAARCGWKRSHSFGSPEYSETTTEEFQKDIDFTCYKDGLYSNPDNCSTFIQCSNGHPYLLICPTGLHFSQKLERCESQCDARCDLSLTEECGWSEDEVKKIHIQRQFDPLCSIWPCPILVSPRPDCPNDEDCDGDFEGFKTEEDCVGECAIRKKKMKGIQRQFDPPCSIVPCPFRADCPNGEDCDGDFEGFKTEEDCVEECAIRRKNMKDSKVSNPRLKEVYTCTRDGLYPNRDDCSSYIECSNGIPNVMPCPRGLHFSKKTQQCESPCDAWCEPSIAEECEWDEDEVKKIHIQRQFDPCAGSWPCPFRADCPNDEDCDGDFEGFKTEEDCVEECATKKKKVKGIQRQFDPLCSIWPCPILVSPRTDCPNDEDCDGDFEGFKTEEDCVGECAIRRKNVKGSKVSNPQLKEVYTCTRDGLYPNRDDCSSYIECSNGMPYIMPCPRGLHFSKKSQQCESPCDAWCEPSIAEECGWSEDELKKIHIQRQFDPCAGSWPCPFRADCPNDEDCDGDFEGFKTEEDCVGECAIRKKKVKDIQRQYDPCGGRWPCKADCPIDEDCDGDFEGLKTEEDCVGECAINKKNMKDSKVSNPRLKEVYTCTRDGLYPNRDDCSSYIECSNGIPNVMPCPRGLHFSKKTQQCESPCDAWCEPSIADECGWNEEFKKSGPYGMCSLPPVKGPCRGSFKRWYFDSKMGTCMSFVYGGCGGNENRFESKDECEDACLSEDYKVATPYVKEDYICIEDGLYPNRDDCSSYIKCSNGLPYVMPCPRALHFNEETRQCESVCDARCDLSTADTCRWIEENEHNDICRLPSEKGPCDSYMKRYFFDWTRGMCRSFLYSGCRGNENNFRTKEDCENRCLRYTVSPPTTESSSIRPSYDFTCIRDGLYPNPEECSSFIQCAHGSPYVMQCPGGLHFSENLKRCEYPCNARCDPSIVKRCGWEESSKYSGSKKVPTKYSPNIASQKTFGIEISCGEDGLYPNPDDCATYIECSNGLPNLKPCPRGLHFSQETERCEAPCDAHCDTEIAEECGWEDSDVSQFLKYPKIITKRKSLHSDIICIKDGVYPNPENCISYIECSNSLPYIMPCPSGLHFSEETQRCESPCDAHCDSDIAEECGWEESSYKKHIKHNSKHLPYKKAVVTEITCHEDGLYPDIENCTTYIECSNGQPHMQTCPEGLHFSEETQNCESPCDALCDRKIAEECGWERSSLKMYSKNSKRYSSYQKTVATEFSCVNDGTFPNPEDCTTYIECFYGLPYVRICPEEQHFNGITRRCESPCDAHCDPNIADECDWKESGLERSPQEWCWLDGLYVCMDEHLKSERVSIHSEESCEMDGLHPNPENCTTYMQCSNGLPYILPCPEGLHFSEETQKCESPCVAHCDPSIAEECNWEDSVKPSGFRQLLPPIPSMVNKQMAIHKYIKCEEGKVYPDIFYCNKYLQCYGGRFFVFPCDEGLHFSEENKKCEAPCDAKCDRSLADKCGWIKKGFRQLLPPIPSMVNKRMTIQEYSSCEEGKVYPDILYCDRYLQCFSGRLFLIPCPQGLHFSEEDKKCEAPCDAKCERNLADECGWIKKENERSSIHEESESYQCPSPNGKFSDFFDCTTYYECRDGRPSKKQCPDGKAFDHLDRRCVPESSARCIYTCRNRSGLYSYRPDSHKYIRCVNGISKVESCSSGQVFDRKIGDCVYSTV